MKKKELELTDEQSQVLHAKKEPIYIVDTNSRNQYVMVPAKEYEYYRALFENDEFDISESLAAQEQALQDFWNEPELDKYGQA